MENLETFEVTFYDGEKIVRTSESKVNIFDSEGGIVAINTEDDFVRALWIHYQQCFEHCKTLERTLSSILSEGECFPIIVGRRPATAPVLCVSKCNSNNVILPRMPSVS